MTHLRRLLLPTAACCGLVLLAATGTWAQEEKEKEEKKVDLKVGDPAPEFTAKDDKGKEWKSKEHFGKKKIVAVFFFPAAFTGG
jgi:cytochrome oxidase Cu insertion factor (SCO1/SenC/PrrC family)